MASATGGEDTEKVAESFEVTAAEWSCLKEKLDCLLLSNESVAYSLRETGLGDSECILHEINQAIPDVLTSFEEFIQQFLAFKAASPRHKSGISDISQAVTQAVSSDVNEKLEKQLTVLQSTIQPLVSEVLEKVSALQIPVLQQPPAHPAAPLTSSSVSQASQQPQPSQQSVGLAQPSGIDEKSGGAGKSRASVDQDSFENGTVDENPESGRTRFLEQKKVLAMVYGTSNSSLRDTAEKLVDSIAKISFIMKNLVIAGYNGQYGDLCLDVKEFIGVLSEMFGSQDSIDHFFQFAKGDIPSYSKGKWACLSMICYGLHGEMNEEENGCRLPLCRKRTFCLKVQKSEGTSVYLKWIPTE